MSILGAGGAAGYIIPASIAGTQRNHAEADRVRGEQSAQKARVDAHDRATGEQDVEPEFTPDRDVDGRVPYQPPERNPKRRQPPADEAADRPKPAPVTETGIFLDLDA